MTYDQFIKALKCCAEDDCDNCPNDFGNCYANLANHALGVIKYKDAKIRRLTDRLNATIAGQETLQKHLANIKVNTIKEFARRLKDRFTAPSWGVGNFLVVRVHIDNLVKEMVGEE